MSIIHVEGLKDAPVNNLLDKGNYHVQIVSATEYASPKKGTPGIKFEFNVIMGPFQSNGTDPTGRKIFFDLYLPVDGPGRAFGLMRLAQLEKAVGIPQDDDLNLDDFVGKELIIKLGRRESEDGEEQEDVKGFKAISNE